MRKLNYAYLENQWVEKNTLGRTNFVWREYGVGYSEIYLHKDGTWNQTMMPFENSYCATRKEAKALAKKHNEENLTVIRSPRLQKCQLGDTPTWGENKYSKPTTKLFQLTPAWLCCETLGRYVNIPSKTKYIWAEASKEQWKDKSGIEVKVKQEHLNNKNYEGEYSEGYLCYPLRNFLKSKGFISRNWTTLYFRILY